tara:strand:+ start:364 stop:528 length:165 start_codon:yes stop_codon:yes gene_type:complete
MWGLACGGKASRALERAHFFLALKLVAAVSKISSAYSFYLDWILHLLCHYFYLL